MPYSVQNAPVKDTLTLTLVFIDAVGFKSQRPSSQSVSEPEVSDQMAGVLLGRGGDGARGAHRLCSPPELVAPDEGLDKVPPPPEHWHTGANW